MSSANYTPFQNEGDGNTMQRSAVNAVEHGKPMQRSAVYALEQPALPPYTDVVVTDPTPPIIIRHHTVIPKDYFGLALFVTLCCFLPLGIVALIKSNDVRVRAAHGDQLGAQQASQHAQTFSMIGLGIGVASWAISLVVLIIYIAAVVVAVNEMDVTPQPILENIN
ncbi:transmembrane protein 91-like [Amphiura filiformis]|uniref:transmembrane protein 91-like n=1 Tax=Amphiura filiformis TaxID=82378 RepID=UPI003B20C425